MPVCPLQCDFHPGNVKYDRNGYVTGIYDFDWAKMDIRLFEFGLGMVFTSSRLGMPIMTAKSIWIES